MSIIKAYTLLAGRIIDGSALNREMRLEERVDPFPTRLQSTEATVAAEEK